MEKLKALMETEEMNLFVENNQELIAEVTSASSQFCDVIFDYVMRNPEIFIEANLEDMKKNIRTFSEASMAQYLTEITVLASKNAKIVEPLTPENALDDYI